MSDTKTVSIYVNYANGIVLSDSDGSPFDPKHPDKFKSDVPPNGKIVWESQNKQLILTGIIVDHDPDKIFKQNPSKNSDGTWDAKLDNKQAGTAKYSIQYSWQGVTQPALDPIIKIPPPTNV